MILASKQFLYALLYWHQEKQFKLLLCLALVPSYMYLSNHSSSPQKLLLIKPFFGMYFVRYSSRQKAFHSHFISFCCFHCVFKWHWSSFLISLQRGKHQLCQLYFPWNAMNGLDSSTSKDYCNKYVNTDRIVALRDPVQGRVNVVTSSGQVLARPLCIFWASLGSLLVLLQNHLSVYFTFCGQV